MIQHRVFIANSSDIDVDIKNATIQAILKSGDRAAYIKDGIIYYAVDPAQEQWYSIGGKSDPASTPYQSILGDSVSTDVKGNSIPMFKILSESKTDDNGNTWTLYTIEDYALREKDTRHSHIDAKSTSDYIKSNYSKEETATVYNFENVLATIFYQKITSTNHNIDDVPRTLTSDDLIRKFNENNLINYGVHLDQMHSVKLADGSQITEDTDPADFITDAEFENITSGIYRFPIAKIMHSANSEGIVKDIRKVNVMAFKDNALYRCQMYVSLDSCNIIYNKYRNCSSSDISTNVIHKDNYSIVYIDVMMYNDYTKNMWICNAICTGFEHTRFVSALDSQFHSVAGTSYDCFGSDTDLYKYKSSDASTYSNQERYKVDQLFSKGYSYMLKVSIVKDTMYSYEPSFAAGENKTIDVYLDELDLMTEGTLSADNMNIYYETGTARPTGVLSVLYSDTFNDRQYTASIYVDTSNLNYEVETIDGKTYNVITINVTPTRGKASLTNEFNIAFVSFAGDRDVKSASSNYQEMDYDLDSHLSNPDITYLTFNKDYFSLLGTPTGNGNTANGILNVITTDTDKIASVYCSADCRGNSEHAVNCFPYISPTKKLQYTYINDSIKNKLAISTLPDLDELNTKVLSLTKNKISFTEEEYNNITSLDDLYSKIASKLYDNWNGLIPSNELYYFNMGCSYFNNPTYLNKEYTFTGSLAPIPYVILGKNRNIYNVIFYLKSNKLWKDTISHSEITTSEHNIYVNLKSDVYTAVCPSSFQHGGYTYKLTTMTEVNRRVIADQSMAWDLTDIDSKNYKYRDAVFSNLYKLEPAEGKTVEDYPSDDIYLEGYDADDMSKGRWLFINPVLQDTRNSSTASPIDFIEYSDKVRYDKSTHIFTFLDDDGNIESYKYAIPYDIISTTTEPDADWISNATNNGLPLCMIVEFVISGINNLSENYRNVLKNNTKKYIEEYKASHPEITSILEVPGIFKDSYSDTAYAISLDIEKYPEMKEACDNILKISVNALENENISITNTLSDTAANEYIIKPASSFRFYYNDSDVSDEKNYEATYVYAKASELPEPGILYTVSSTGYITIKKYTISSYDSSMGTDVLYGKYAFDGNNWNFSFITGD